MAETSAQQLLLSIKQDSLSLFSAHIKGNENISFGRFPLLSLCYLWNAKRIIRKFEKYLFVTKTYRIEPEDLESSRKFVSVAGKCLRLYLSGEIVSPIEMLALLGRDCLVKRKFVKIKNNEGIAQNIVKIYKINGRKINIIGKKLQISKRTMTGYQKRICVSIVALALVCVLVLTGGVVSVSATIGLGTRGIPFKISSARQFEKCLSTNGSYKLTQDVYLDSDFSPSDFGGVIDGAGYSVYVGSNYANSIVLKNTGVIKNINLVYSDIKKNIETSFSFLVQQNTGTISNVNISCGNVNLICERSQDFDMYVSGIACENYGSVLDCSLFINAEIKGIATGECSASGFVGKNFGTIRNLVLTKGSKVSTKECDLAGIVVSNEESGVVVGCKNFAELQQSNVISDWSPNVAGVAMLNYGLIDGSFNYGNLSVESNSELGNGGNVFLGGICAMSYGDITKCYSSGSLHVFSKNLIVYCGGISAYCSYYQKPDNSVVMPAIDGCIVDGNMDIIAESENAFVFGGGFAGYLYGAITNCYSTCDIDGQYSDAKYFLGTCLGSAYLQYQFFENVICIDVSDVCVLFQESTNYQIGILVSSGSVLKDSGVANSLSQIESLSTRDQIVQKEGYWYGKN
ncbi:MAG: hypothetical protein IJW59_04900 [Clostridia bacterium]|nr:hypothetical protein [Clostridia bacterium]